MSRQEDALIAEQIFGKKVDHERMTYGLGFASVAPYTSDIGLDYSVHRLVCTNWPFSQRRNYFKALDDIVQERVEDILNDNGQKLMRVAWPDALSYYEVGDFSRSALRALQIEYA